MKKGLSYLLITIAAIAFQAKAQTSRAVYSQVVCSTETARYEVDLRRKELKISTLNHGKWLLNDFVRISRLETHTIETQPLTTEYVFNLQEKSYKISAIFRGQKLNGIGELDYGSGNSSLFEGSCERLEGKSRL